MAALDAKIGFVGGGQMARALAQGFLAAELTKPSSLGVVDVSPQAAEEFSAACDGAAVHDSADALCEASDIIVLAVKPQHMDGVLKAVQGAADESKLFISVAAGVPLNQLENRLVRSRVIRVMPNTPCLVRQGASAFSLGQGATDADRTATKKLLGAVGIAFEVAEPLLDAVTGLSGSGPAFVFMAIEALADGGVAAGLPRTLASQFAVQTVLGAAQLVIDTDEHPAILKDRVASPAGTTIAGIQELENAGFRGGLINAVQAAADRARELGNQ